ncbi:cytochrome P450 84A1-like [Gossypium australe]|uniref:Cytochrome P450 84A1-like n=1 Tax=Gossypium australe TaxID=47621 RepID=A0A5B6U8A5_9ROSI|nr:cytochrome P450 84A1-like [Gossypium australe]
MDSLQTLLSPQSPPIFFLVSALLVSFVFMFGLPRKTPYPPGPKGYPIIGNMMMMDQLTHRGLAHLSRQYDHAGLLHLTMGKLHIVAVSTPEMAREVLLTQDSIYSNRPANDAIVYLTYDRADMAFANYGPFWRQMRKICVMKVFSRKRAESWASVREEVGSTVRTVMKSLGSPLNVGELVFALTRNITYRAAFGSFSRDGQEELVKILQEFSKLFGAFNIADFFPWMGWIHGGEFQKRLVKARASLDGFIDHIIDEHLVTRERRKTGDDAAAKYDDDMDVMFGGTETVASAIEWAMAELMNSPEELKKVQQELSDVVGLERVVHESDLEKLTYLKCAIKETLRLHPPIPLLLHETAVDSVLGGKARSKRSKPTVPTWSVGSLPISESSSSTASSSSTCSGSSMTSTELANGFRVPPTKKQKKKPVAVQGSGLSSGNPFQRRCSHCQVQKTPQWRTGPLGAKTLCNACGVRYKSGRLFPEYRPACSPTFSGDLHSNSHRKVLEMRKRKELAVNDSVESTRLVPSF